MSSRRKKRLLEGLKRGEDQSERRASGNSSRANSTKDKGGKDGYRRNRKGGVILWDSEERDIDLAYVKLVPSEAELMLLRSKRTETSGSVR